jgi:hypothetical protein
MRVIFTIAFLLALTNSSFAIEECLQASKYNPRWEECYSKRITEAKWASQGCIFVKQQDGYIQPGSCFWETDSWTPNRSERWCTMQFAGGQIVRIKQATSVLVGSQRRNSLLVDCN